LKVDWSVLALVSLKLVGHAVNKMSLSRHRFTTIKVLYADNGLHIVKQSTSYQRWVLSCWPHGPRGYLYGLRCLNCSFGYPLKQSWTQIRFRLIWFAMNWTS